MSYDDTSKFGVPDSEREQVRLPKLAGGDGGKQESKERPRVIITSYRTRLLDKDNAYSGAKYLLDSVKHSGFVHDDSEKEINYEVIQIKVAHRKEEHTTVDIIYADN